MGKTVTKVIKRWDAGMTTARRGVNLEAGASLVSHFDVFTNPNKLTPMPAWESWITNAEKGLKLKGLGSYQNSANSDTIYATGYALQNWIGYGWGYRVKFTPNTSNLTSIPEQVGIDLSRMPAGFWTHVNSDGTDIRPMADVSGTHKYIPYQVVGFDSVNKKGWVFFATPSTSADIYIYYGNSGATAHISGYDKDLAKRFAYNAATHVFHFEQSGYDEIKGDTVFYTTSYTLANGSPTYSNTAPSNNLAQIGYHLTGNITSDPASAPMSDINRSTVSVSFNLRVNATPGGLTSLVTIANATQLDIKINTSRQIVAVANDGTTRTITGSTALVADDRNYRVRVEFNSNSGFFKLFINGVQDANLSTSFSQLASGSSQFPYLNVNASTSYKIDNLIIGTSTDSGGLYALCGYKVLYENENCYTIGSEVAQADVTLSYVGVSLYEKATSGSAFSETLVSGSSIANKQQTVQIYKNALISNEYGVIPSFVWRTSSTPLGNTFFFPIINNGTPANTSDLMYMVKLNDDADTHGQMTMSSPVSSIGTNRNVPMGIEGIDARFYHHLNSQSAYYLSGVSETAGFTAFPTLQSITNYNGYVALGGHRRNNSWVQIWDRSSTAGSQTIDFGVGKLKVVAVTSGKLFAVINNYIDDATKALGKPSLELKRWVGGNTVRTTHKFDFATTISSFTKVWEEPVSNISAMSRNVPIFYAKIPLDSGTIEGFFGVGVNRATDELSLVLLYDTSSLGNIENFTSVANNVYAIHNYDGSMSRLSSSAYTATSSYRSIVFTGDDSKAKKNLKQIQVMTEPLSAGQTITIYVRKDGETNWTQVGTHTGTGAMFKEFLNMPSQSNKNLPMFRELEFRIDSTGGSASVEELQITYEEATNRV